MGKDSLEEHLRLLEERLLQPKVRKSAKELETLLKDHFTEIGSSGHIYNKQQVIATLTSSESIIQMTLMDFKPKLLAPDVVLTTYRVVKHKDMKYSLRSSIWKSKEDKWRMVFHQGTPSATT